MKDEKNENFATFSTIAALLLTVVIAYYQMAPTLVERGWTFGGMKIINGILKELRPLLSGTWYARGLVILLLIGAAAMRTNKAYDKSPTGPIVASILGTLLYLLPIQDRPFLFPITMIVGLFVCSYGYSMLGHLVIGISKAPEEDLFLQCDERIETDYSINIPYHYMYEKKRHDAYINVVAPFRASMVMGTPGSGKSFAIYNKCIEDMVRKGYTMFLYDYKFPDLTEELLNEIYYQRKYEGLWKDQKVLPKMYILNFDDPMRSNRCNPIRHSYITDPADTTEIADLLFKNINKGTSKGSFDFFNESAKVYLDALICFLANYDPDAIYGGDDGYTVVGSKTDYVNKGCYCTFPHVIELMACNYEKTFQILQFTHGLEAKISPFASALEKGTMEQLLGQVASAQIPLGRFVSPALYWIMTGDDFTLDINNPEEPKIVCMGNNPKRQSIYGSAIALYTSRMFALINQKHKLHSAVLFDELPTVFIKGLDNLIATARSNKVAIILGAQDRSQLKRDYGDDEAKVIFSTVGNILSGQVNEETAEALSKMFGKEFREQQSRSISMDAQGNDSKSISFQQQEIMPASRIGTLTQGMFLGRVADNHDTPIERKLFCGTIDVDMDRIKKKKKEWQKVPIITDFFNGVKPTLPEEERTRLSKIYPKLKNNEDKLLEKYMEKKNEEAVMRNFEKVKKDIHTMVEREYLRTKPFADAYKAEQGIEE